MKRALLGTLLGACICFPACGRPPGVPQAVPSPVSAVGPERQLLVMLRMPAPHLRAGADYSGNYPDDGNRAARQRTAAELASEHHLRIVDNWPMPVIGVDCFVMERQADAAAAPVFAALARDPRVAWAQPVNLFHGQDGGDPLYPVQPDGKYWHLAELHRLSTGRGVRVALVDSGVDVRHPDLARQVELQENFVDQAGAPAELHGTAVAGIVAAREGNGVGIAGVAPDAKLMALRACWQLSGQRTQCSSFTLGKALNFAIIHDARVINLSLGGPSDRLLQALLSAAVRHGTTVVGAFDPSQADGGFPANSASVLAVAAQPADSVPRHVLLAPGTDVPTCLPGQRWGFVSGSSYAAAHVAGLVALLAQLAPASDSRVLEHGIVTRSVGSKVERASIGGASPAIGGTIDACATIARAAATCACSCSRGGVSKASSEH
jgi:subtilisin family serine protease